MADERLRTKRELKSHLPEVEVFKNSFTLKTQDLRCQINTSMIPFGKEPQRGMFTEQYNSRKAHASLNVAPEYATVFFTDRFVNESN